MVVADTSPLNYLILLGADNVLPQLYGEIAVPGAVIGELRHSDAPSAVTQWIANPPAWLSIFDVRGTTDKALDDLGDGEREAIVLAEDQGPEILLLMDETRGRSEAARRGIATTGTLGVLDAAAEAGLLDLPATVSQLLLTTFFVTPSLLKRMLERDAARRRAG